MSIIRNTLRESNETILDIRDKMREEVNEQTNLISQIKDYVTLYGEDGNIETGYQNIIAQNGALTAENSSLRSEKAQLLARIAELESQLNGG